MSVNCFVFVFSFVMRYDCARSTTESDFFVKCFVLFCCVVFVNSLLYVFVIVLLFLENVYMYFKILVNVFNASARRFAFVVFAFVGDFNCFNMCFVINDVFVMFLYIFLCFIVCFFIVFCSVCVVFFVFVRRSSARVAFFVFRCFSVLIIFCVFVIVFFIFLCVVLV